MSYKTGNMNYTHFKVVARNTSNSGPVIKGTSFHSELGTVITILKDGTIINRLPYEQEKNSVFHEVLSRREPMPGKENHIRFYGEYKYASEQDEKELPHMDQVRNKLYRKWHEYIRQHDHVVVKGEDGNNINVNNLHSAYELIDVTANTLKEAGKNKKRIEAGDVLNVLYNGDKKAFVDFCYAYSVPDVAKFDNETLFNLCMLKMQNNPEHFLQVYNNKNRDILTLIEIGLNKDISTSAEPKKALDLQSTGTFYLDGQPIAQNRAELEEVLLLDVTKRRILEALVNYSVTASKQLDAKDARVSKSDPTSIQKEVVQNQISEEKLMQEYINSTRLKIARSKNLDELREKLMTQLTMDRFKPIYAWGVEHIAAELKKKEEQGPDIQVMETQEM